MLIVLSPGNKGVVVEILPNEKHAAYFKEKTLENRY